MANMGWMTIARRRSSPNNHARMLSLGEALTNGEEPSPIISDMVDGYLPGSNTSPISVATKSRCKNDKTHIKFVTECFFRLGLFVFICISCHRLMIWTRRAMAWTPAPIIHLTRACPKSKYQTLPQQQQVNEQQKQKICLVTLTDVQNRSTLQKYFGWRNYNGLLDISWKNKQDYAIKHGYKLFDESAIVDPSRPPAWSKSLAVQRLLTQEDCDWVFWLDADTVIMNSSIAVEQFLPLDPNQHFVIAQDEHRVDVYNSGAWIIRNSEWSLQLMKDWWNEKDYIRSVGLIQSGDQDALSALLTSTGQFQMQHAVVSPMCQFNSFIKVILPWQYDFVAPIEQASYYQSEYYYHKGDFLAHAAGIDNKAAILKTMLEMAS